MIKTKLPSIEELNCSGTASATDVTFILGALQAISPSNSDGKYQTCMASSSTDQYGNIKVLSGYGHNGIAGADDIRCYGIRPFFKKMPAILTEGDKKGKRFLEIDGQKIALKSNHFGRLVFEYGAYPASAVDADMNQRLEEERKRNNLNPTRHFYTTDGSVLDLWAEGFEPYKNLEYEFEGERYVRFRVQNSEMFYLSNGEMMSRHPIRWAKVEPIRWIYNTDRNLIYAEQALLSGLRWNEKSGNKRYSKSLIARYLDDVFDQEIMQSHDFLYARQMAEQIEDRVAGRVVDLMTQGKSRAEQRQMLPQFNERERKEAIQQLLTPSPERTKLAWLGFNLHRNREKAILQEKQAQEALQQIDETATPKDAEKARWRAIKAQQIVEQRQALCREYMGNARV